ncbi:acyl carrier protein [Caulobacter sp. S45]|uniref:acyl carrier protein n=1 Tax=Caulobacter sp. S45 TaxID=1641861 RepID=UPI001576DF07|nr:acyl carrier protein [Caulobacter sp. S45]
MAQTLYAVVANALNIDPAGVNEDSGLDATLNWDSLRQVILITEIERAYDVEFDLDTINKATSVRSIREMLSQKGVQAD